MTRLALALVLLLPACEQKMADQRRYDTYEAAPLWRDGTSARPIPDGTVAQGDLAYLAAIAEPPPVTAALLAEGRRGYETFCAPCHGLTGAGDGMIVQRGFPPPPSYHTQRLRAAPAAHFLSVIANGYGVMYSYAARVTPADRWAIVAYIRALQLAHGVEVASIPGAREHLP